MSASRTPRPRLPGPPSAHQERPRGPLRRGAGPLAALLALLAPTGAGAQNLPEVSVRLVGGVWVPASTAHHSLTVTIQPGTSYRVSSTAGTHTVVVPDDDLHEADGTVTYGVQDPRLAGTGQDEDLTHRCGDPHTATFRVLDDDLPPVGIEVAPDSGDEGRTS